MTLRSVCIAAIVIASPYVASGQMFEQPVLVTSAGQSADVTMVGMMCKRLKIDARVDAKATDSGLEGVKTLIIVPGFSSKGLGAAGTSSVQEMERVTSIIEGARKSKVKILVMHIGGIPRRGTQSDPFNKIASEAAARLIVVKQGNQDEFFSSIAQEKKIPIELVDKIADTMKPLEAAFKE